MDNITEGDLVSQEMVNRDALTPLPKVQGKAMTMDFPNAIREIIKGNKIARLSWSNGDYGLLKDGWLTIYTKNEFHTWSVNDGDLEGQDWVIVKEME